MTMPPTITFEFYNGFDGSSLGSGTLPYDRMKAMNGHYTRLWRKFKPGLAEIFRLDKRHVRVKVTRDNRPPQILIVT